MSKTTFKAVTADFAPSYKRNPKFNAATSYNYNYNYGGSIGTFDNTAAAPINRGVLGGVKTAVTNGGNKLLIFVAVIIAAVVGFFVWKKRKH